MKPIRAKQHTDLELGYMAGFFDGEGCISVVLLERKSGRLYPKVQIHASQKVKQPLCLLEKYFGGNIYGQPAGEPSSYRWTASTQNAVDFLEAVVHLLIVKREQAEDAIRVWNER